MLPCNQTKNWSTCLHTWTLPKYSLYGNFSGTTFVCINANVKFGAGYAIKIWDGKKWRDTNTAYKKRGEKRCRYGGIYIAIENFKKSGKFIPEKPVVCKTAKQDDPDWLEFIGERAETRRKSDWQKNNMMDAPRAKTPSVSIYRPHKTSGDIANISFKNEEKSCIDLQKIGYVGFDYLKKAEKVGHPTGYFEKGQNTCGEASEECPYTRSGFETRDGMKVRFADYHGQKPERPTVSNPYRVEKDPTTGKHYRTYNGVRIEE